MTREQIKENVKVVAKTVWNATKEGFTKVVKGLSSLAGEALSACETKKAVADIQAQGMLYNLQRQAMREMPIIPLNSGQEEALLFPEYRGKGAWIQLDPDQTDYVFQQSLEQRCLDKDSRAELAAVVAPKVGVPALLELVATAHETVGRELVIPLINKGIQDEYKIEYEDMVNDPIFEGTIQSIKLRYNVHSSEACKKFYWEYKKSRQLVNKIRRQLRLVGVDIDHIKVVDTIFLEVHLKWVGA